jgi:hypothetical protein
MNDATTPTRRRRPGRPRNPKPNGAINGASLFAFDDADDAPPSRAAAADAVRDAWSRLFAAARLFATTQHAFTAAAAELERADSYLSQTESVLAGFGPPKARRRKAYSRRASVSPSDEREVAKG